MQKMMQEMADTYMASTNITVEYTGNGSSAGIRAVAGTANIGAVSRVVMEEELNQGLRLFCCLGCNCSHCPSLEWCPGPDQ